MYSSLIGKGIIAFSDPAGAKCCLGLAMILKNKFGNRGFQIFSNKEYDFFSDWDLHIIVLDKFHETVFEDKPDWVFTGTSHPESSNRFELQFLEFANILNIPSWSFVDHWTSIGIRFKNFTRYTFPDTILVLDEKAKAIAIEEGINEKLLLIKSNPYLDYIRELWKPSSNNIAAFKDYQKQNDFSYSILFAPDPLSLRNEDQLWGFNEASALSDILEIVRDYSHVALFIKKHPLQPDNILEEVIDRYHNSASQVIFVQKFTNLDLMYFSDLIIGFHSNFLLEADALGKPIIRYYPVSVNKDPISHLAIGKVICNKVELKNLLDAKLTL